MSSSRGLIDAAKVAIGPNMPQAQATEALLATRAMLALIDRTMPQELQVQDSRVVAGRLLERALADVIGPAPEVRR